MSLKYYIINDNGKQVEIDKEQQAIERIKFAYEVSQYKGLGDLYVAFSGGKDSTVLADLVKRSGVPYTLNYNITGLDYPELIYHMWRHYPELIWHKQPINPETGKCWTMWSLIIKKRLPPTRKVRYCCSVLKEISPPDKIVLMGIRAEESPRRATYESFKYCGEKKNYQMLPIFDWTDSDVWEYHAKYKLAFCSLYGKIEGNYEVGYRCTGKKRLGCIGCPMSSNQREELDDNPRYKALYLRAFDLAIKKDNEERPNRKFKFGTSEQMYKWFLGNGVNDYPLIDEMLEEE